jgi:hypothetical protein
MPEQSQKDVEDSNEVERLYRRNSLFGASIISIYSISGGSLNNDVSVGFAKITFSNPIALEYSMILVALYFCWRHWLVSRSLRMKLLEYTYRTVSDFKWVSHELDTVSESLKSSVNHYLDEQGESIPVVTHHKTFSNIGFVEINYHICFENRPGKYEFRILRLSFFKMPFLFMAINLKYRCAWFKNAVNNTHFGDGFLPLTLMSVAIALYFLK